MGIIRAASVVVGALLVFQPSDDMAERVQDCWDASRRAEEAPPCLADAAESLAPAVLASRWGELSKVDRARFVEALSSALHRDILALPDTALQFRERVPGELRYQLGEHRVGVRVAGERVTDVSWGRSSATRHYRRVASRLYETYSFDYLVGELENSGVVVLEDFDTQDVGGLPRGWKSRGWGDVDHMPYVVVEENGNRFLRAEDRGENVMLYKEVRWSSAEYPYISWRWRVRSVPQGADARYEKTADSAAGVYLSYRRKLGLVPETVKFVWSAHLPRGSAFRRPGVGMPWTVIAGSGEPDDAWHRVVYRVADVYARTFDGSAGERPLGIAVLSDANNTNGLAAADYDDFVVLRDAHAIDRVEQILDVKN